MTVVTCPTCGSRHLKHGDTNYCPDCPIPRDALLERLEFYFWPDEPTDVYDEMGHDDMVGWDIGGQ